MKICFPVTLDEGLDSYLYRDFDSAPTFVVVDTEASETWSVEIREIQQSFGVCQSLKLMREESVDAIVVGAIGSTALQEFNLAGLKVYQALGVTIADNITCLEQIGLPEFN